MLKVRIVNLLRLLYHLESCGHYYKNMVFLFELKITSYVIYVIQNLAIISGYSHAGF